ncbi:AraC family transcriptional regulator [Undibacterium sp. 5I1]|uniref:AraC family transcriptional regulator n=1 Tax=unclassified Undibacterium TaxID=2630295 RepID=UPI002AB53A04|nr:MULTISPECIES: AraC family transcriptional regulator [unclassified Undibacterium]MDY7540022.1 AraC family transcriptional regulator [Undibacterium sp. 5I1]MEB0232472.1 AraC family transcriptional regulator [Undibacterium sp. 10I3]MEB0257869.1 AraC family transcriptional regulator [Undibacterium sp. 5I1]
MDPLSRLIKLVRPQASLDLRCLLGGAFSIQHEQEAEGVVPFHLVLSGTCVIETKGSKPLILEAGDFVLYPNGGAHLVRDNLGGSKPIKSTLKDDGDFLPVRSNGKGAINADLLCGRFLCERGSAALLFGTLPDPLHISLARSHPLLALQTLVALIRDEADSKNSGALAIVTSLSQALLVMALRIYGEHQSDVPNILTLLTDSRLSASIQALMIAPGHQWTIAELGARAAMSRATYARHFKAKAGMTVSEFLSHVRMATASALLLHTKRNAGDIGMEVGYQSEAAFGKAFRINTGFTPGRYRQQLQENIAANQK